MLRVRVALTAAAAQCDLHKAAQARAAAMAEDARQRRESEAASAQLMEQRFERAAAHLERTEAALASATKEVIISALLLRLSCQLPAGPRACQRLGVQRVTAQQRVKELHQLPQVPRMNRLAGNVVAAEGMLQIW